MSEQHPEDLQAQLDAANQRIAELEAAPATEQSGDPAPPAAPADTAQDGWTLDNERGPLYNGVPMLALDNPFGGFGVGILIGVDLEAKHEAGQRRLIADSDPPQYEPVPKSGGSAYYQDFLGSHGWTVALNPEQP